uniref:Si:ch211-182p11.1 n=1 Tax=Sphaeramia orbicularis TaxID=375764 RepID=A0A673C6Z6_9TELE
MLHYFSELTSTVCPLYPIAGYTTQRSLDGSSPPITLQRPFVYFGKTYNNTIYVNHNGHLTFDQPWWMYIAQRFPRHGSRDLIAPFWTDVDIRQTGLVFYNQYISGHILQRATQDINQYFPEFNFVAKWVFVATWYEVPYYPFYYPKATFQAVLISGGQYSFVLMNYGEIAGYDTISSKHHFSIPGSFSNNASDIRLTSNVNVIGRWAFRIDNGSRGCMFNGKTTKRTAAANVCWNMHLFTKPFENTGKSGIFFLAINVIESVSYFNFL